MSMCKSSIVAFMTTLVGMSGAYAAEAVKPTFSNVSPTSAKYPSTFAVSINGANFGKYNQICIGSGQAVTCASLDYKKSTASHVETPAAKWDATYMLPKGSPAPTSLDVYVGDKDNPTISTGLKIKVTK